MAGSMTKQTRPARVTVSTYYGVNELFKYKLSCWYEEAAAEGRKQKFTYKAALNSLKKYPLELKSGKEAAKALCGVGGALAQMLDQSLRQFREEFGCMPTVKKVAELGKEERRNAGPTGERESTVRHVNLTTCRKIAAKRRSQKLCSASGAEAADASRPESGTSNSRLEEAATPRYFDRLRVPDSADADRRLEQNCRTANNLTASHSGSLSLTNAVELVPTVDEECAGEVWPAGSFEVVLLVDTQEQLKFDDVVAGVRSSGIRVEVRQLKLGDYLWVAQHKENRRPLNSAPKELVLNFIVERKRLDDLAHSIKSDRYRDQKQRMKICGLMNKIYLVEYYNVKHCSLSEQALWQAIVNTQVQEEFYAKVTSSARETALYLSVLTRQIALFYNSRDLVHSSSGRLDGEIGRRSSLQSFAAFQLNSTKSQPLALRELLARQLMVIPRMTGSKACAVAQLHGTFRELLEAYRNCPTREDKDRLLANVPYEPADPLKKLGLPLSKHVARFYQDG